MQKVHSYVHELCINSSLHVVFYRQCLVKQGDNSSNENSVPMYEVVSEAEVKQPSQSVPFYEEILLVRDKLPVKHMLYRKNLPLSMKVIKRMISLSPSVSLTVPQQISTINATASTLIDRLYDYSCT